jgi:phage-related protein
MDTLTVPYAPLVASGGSDVQARALQNHYVSDAYANVRDGINVALKTYQASWLLDSTAGDTLVAFLRAHLGKSFLWTLPRESTPRIWQATGWTRTTPDYGYDKIDVTLEERILP